MALNRKALRSINNIDNGESLTNGNLGRLRDKEKRLIHIKQSLRNEFIREGENDELI